MAHAVFSHKIHVRRLRCFPGHEFVHGGNGLVSQKYWTGLRVERFNMPDAVILLVGPRELVFLDGVPQVILAARRCHQPDLAVSPHDLSVQIKAGLRILDQRAVVDQFREVLFPLGINFRRIQVGAGRQINLRFAHMEKTQGIARRHLPRLLRGHDVVR